MLTWSLRPYISLALGSDLEGRTLCHEHAGRDFGIPLGPRAACVCPCELRRCGVGTEPVEINTEEHEQIVERVASIDVAKASGEVCTRVPDASVPGRRVTRVWSVEATTNAIIELADQLARERVERWLSSRHRTTGVRLCICCRRAG